MKILSVLPRSRELAARVVQPFHSFFEKEVSSGVLLVSGAVVAMIWANSPYAHGYHQFWHQSVSIAYGDSTLSKSLLDWIDEGLMTLFFFTVGLEIKRQILVGELASLRKALLPVIAALGGMLFPAAIYASFTWGTGAVKGWGIPMATDIAFALGAVALLGSRVPLALRIFLAAFAIADDLGAVLVIAVFYTKEVVVKYLLVASGFALGLAILNVLWVRKTLPYALLGLGLWLAMLGSGLHATVAGIIVAVFVPARGRYDTDKFMSKVTGQLGNFHCPPDGCGHSILLDSQHLNAVQSIEVACHDVETPLQRLEHTLHPWVAYVVIPLFALANGGVTLSDVDLAAALTAPLTLGIAVGLALGKPVGITLFSWIALRSGLAALPAGVSWSHLVGAGILGGMGFTMSLFISGLSFSVPVAVDMAKIGILMGSVVSGALGLLFLGPVLNRRERPALTAQPPAPSK